MSINPFNVTKAVDFDENEINKYWVDLNKKNGFFSLAKPNSYMPMYILGGKGSGKTHLMKHYSHIQQIMREGKNIFKKGYLGIYMRCGGLNSERFSGKGISDETWNALFCYHIDLWLASLILEVLTDIREFLNTSFSEQDIVKKVIRLFNEELNSIPTSLTKLQDELIKMRKEIDVEIDNCVFAPERISQIRIKSTRSSLVFGIPKVLSETIPELSAIKFIYLIDELENLLKPQQRYLNALIRERENPVSFKIGSRLYGQKTMKVYGDEKNHIGSEYEVLHLDDELRDRKQGEYKLFVEKICSGRLSTSKTSFDKLFETPRPRNKYLIYATEISDKFNNKERPYFKKLRKSLENVSLHKDDIETIIDLLKVDDYPILEKINLLLLYREWSESGAQSLTNQAKIINKDSLELIASKFKDKNIPQSKIMNHWHYDLLAQLIKECRIGYLYPGFDSLVEISQGMPRHLLIALKEIYKWSNEFFKEESFTESRKISIRAQKKGLEEASEWFFKDATSLSKKFSRKLRDSISRLANLFRAIRYSDKPVECSLCSFSIESSKISKASSEMIDLAVNYSLLIEINSGQKDKNTGCITSQYQLNPMLSPRWGLSISRRGTYTLNAEMANAIFDSHNNNYDILFKDRKMSLNAPFKSIPKQGILFDEY